MIRDCLEELKWNFKLFLLRLRYPKAGKYTLVMLGWGYTLKELDEDIKELFVDGFDSANKWSQREEMAEIDSQYWEIEKA